MTQGMIQKLASMWVDKYERGEEVQWELASIAYQAVDVEGASRKEFAELVGKATGTIDKYRNVWIYRESHPDETFADAVVLSQSSEERQAALHMVADSNGITLSQAKNKTEEIAYFRDIFEHADRDVLKEALKDKDARSRLREISVETVMDDQPKPNQPTGTSRPAVKAPTPEQQSDKMKLQKAMNEMMHTNRGTQTRFIQATDAFVAAVPNQWWNRHFPGETVHRTHGEQVIGDLEKTIRVLNTQLARVKVAVAEANVAAEKRHEAEVERASK